MTFTPSSEIKVSVLPEQREWVGTPEMIGMQRRGYGRKALGALIRLMQERYGLHSMTTTYIWGNTVAAHLYESLGFVETDVVDEPDCHEVNMIFHCV